MGFCPISSKRFSIDSETGILMAKPPHFEQATLQRGLSPPESHLSSIIKHLLHLYSCFSNPNPLGEMRHLSPPFAQPMLNKFHTSSIKFR
jgi:hypothetical protein